MADSLVSLQVTDAVATLRLDDPRHRNALSYQLSEDLAAAVAAALAAGAAVVVLTASAPVFCAGGSIDNLLNPVVPLAEVYAGFTALADCPVPTIAAVGSPVIGAGVNLPLACDVVIASESASFDPRFLDLAIHPGGGHLWRLIDRVGSQGAAALSLFGDSLSGREAASAGLAWRCVADDELGSTVSRLAARVAGRDDALVRRTKETLRASLALTSAAAAFDLELEAQEWSVTQPAYKSAVEGVRARLAKGKP